MLTNNSIKRLKNGQYDLHLTLSEAIMFRNLLKNWCKEYERRFGHGCKTVQFDFLKAFDDVIEYPAELIDKEMFECEYSREFLGEIPNDNRPEGVLTQKEMLHPDIFHKYLP